MSTFLLSQNGKVGVYGNGDRVYGSGGTEKAIIMNGAENVVVENTVEEIHVANNMAQLTFRVDTNTNEVSVVSGSTVLAKFAPEAAGIKLFTATGMSVIKSVVDTATGEISFTADNGATGATAIPLPTDATALPADAIDASQKSDNAGGSNPDTPSTEKTYKVADLTDTIIAKGGYVIEDEAANLDPAKLPYTMLNNAKSVILSDDLANLVDGDSLTATAKAALGIAKLDSVKVKGSFEDLLSASASLPEALAAKNPTYVVTKAVTSSVTLKDASVDTVANAQAQIDAFLATVTFDESVSEPAAGTVKLGTYTIKDGAAAIVAANADATLKALLTDTAKCKGVVVADSIEAIGELSNNVTGLVTSFDVKDTLANIAANAKNVPSNSKLNNTFTATDTGDVDLSLSAKGLTNLTTYKPKLDSGLKSISVTADVSEEVTDGLDLSADVATVFSGFTGKVNFTGSNKADKFTTTLDADTISTGAGNDEVAINGGTIGTIDAGAGDDKITINGTDVTVNTINLGETTSTSGKNTLIVTKGSVTTINGGSGVDEIKLEGLTVPAAGTTVTAGEGADMITVNALSKGLTIDLTETTPAKDTVILKAALADLGTSGADAVTIKGFNATNDKILFDDTDFASFLADDTGYDISTGGSGTTLTNKKIFFAASGQEAIVAGNEADLKGYLANSAATGKLGTFANADDAAIVVTKADDTGKAMNFWYVNGGAKTGDSSDDIIVLLGTVNSDTVLDFTNKEIVSA